MVPAAAEANLFPVGMALERRVGVPLPAGVRQVGAGRPLFAWAQSAAERAAPGRSNLEIAEERLLPGGEEPVTPGYIIDELACSPGETGCPGRRQRFGQHKTFVGAARPSSPGWPTFRRAFGTACSRAGRDTLSGLGPFFRARPYAPPDIEDYGQCSCRDQGDGHPPDPS